MYFLEATLVPPVCWNDMKTTFSFFLILFSFSVSAKDEFRLSVFRTESGAMIPELRLGYETYGTLNEKKSNAILITHHYTGNSHAAGAGGYWDAIIGKGKAIDTDKFFVVALDSIANVGTKDPHVITTGPMSVNPATKMPYGFTFPKITVKDVIQSQKDFLTSLGIQKVHAVIGASGGAMQAVAWAAYFPKNVSRVIAVVPPGLSMPPYVKALVDRWMAPILLGAENGLVESLKLVTLSSVYLDWGPAYEERAAKRAELMDPASFVYTGRMVQSFDVEDKIQDIEAKILFIPAEHDMIFPVELSELAKKKLRAKKKSAEVFVLKGRGGHLDGILSIDKASSQMKKFLK